VGLAETKNQQGRKFDETCRFYTCICKERRKKEKVIMRRVATSRKSKIRNRKWKTRAISVCECLIVIFTML